ncbi:TIGR04255 family protein [Specibacter cremeus]|uniref:TIGR04255 family protein n=1 Tax=Specibacter cremeus TaxID=1629051 RepID=UPI000F796CFA|nr:TIGR04255 family protein [Specibacter cremeus]
MNEHEVYPNAPLVSVSFELRHPESDTLTATQRAAFRDMLREHLPMMRSRQATQHTIEVGPSAAIPQVRTEEFPKYFNRKNTIAASFLNGSVVVETSQYPGWNEFSDLIALVCNARHEISPLDGVERVGLRYVDEIRIPTEDSPEWQKYLTPSVLGPGPADVDGLSLKEWQGVAAYGPESGRSLVVRYGTGQGFATDPNAELRRKTTPLPGPFFLLDIDSFWIPELEVPVYSDSAIRDIAELLHKPVREKFEQSITEHLRNEVLRK